jgi:heterodisulfide reductase subunit C
MSEARVAEAAVPTSKLAEEVFDGFGVNVNRCYQCGKCAAGCPVAYAMDFAPAQLIHAVRLGMDDVVLNSKTMWLCAACETCTTRCPQGVDISKVMDAAKITAVKRGVKPAIPAVRSFHQAVLGNVKQLGRMWEPGMVASLKFKTKNFTKDVGLAKEMFQKGKLKALPSLTGALRARRVFTRVQKLEKKAGRES